MSTSTTNLLSLVKYVGKVVGQESTVIIYLVQLKMAATSPFKSIQLKTAATTYLLHIYEHKVRMLLKYFTGLPPQP